MRKSPFHTIIYLSFIILAMSASNLPAQALREPSSLHIEWSRLPPLPALNGNPNAGVAGAFAGISNGMLLVAGGANFPDTPAWEGGQKKFYNSVYAFKLHDGTEGRWLEDDLQFPCAVAYGASLIIGEKVLCIGGMNDNGFLADACLLQWDKTAGRIRVEKLPPLPRPLASLMAANIGRTVYIAGGDDAAGTQKDFYRLDLDRPGEGWQTLPVWPGPPLADGQLIAQSNGRHTCLYLIGGRNSAPGRLSFYYNLVYAYNPAAGIWKARAGITDAAHHPVPLFAGTGIAIGKEHIALFGGNDGKLFTEIEECNRTLAAAQDGRKKAYWQRRKDSIFTHHPGFSRTVYLYNTVTDSWETAGSLAFPAQATTAAFRYGNYVIIPSGEIRPGIRTPDITAGKIEEH